MEEFISTGFLVGVLAMVFWTPYLFAMGVLRITQDYVDFSDRLTCMIPIANLFKADRAYFNKVSVTGVAVSTLLVSVFLKINAVSWWPEIAWVHYGLIVLIILSFAIWFIGSMVGVWIVLRDSGLCAIQSQIIMSILFPIGQWYIGNILYKEIKYYQNQEDLY